MMKKEILQAYYDDIKKERDIRITHTDTIQNQKRIQRCNVQMMELKSRMREMKE